MENQSPAWKERFKDFLKTLLLLIFNPRLLLCLFLGWMITNGWSYVLLGLGILFHVPWMQVVAGAYLSLLWVPFTPEKIFTVIIAIFLLRVFFPKDEKTLGVLKEIHAKLRNQHSGSKERRKQRREARKARKQTIKNTKADG